MVGLAERSAGHERDAQDAQVILRDVAPVDGREYERHYCQSYNGTPKPRCGDAERVIRPMARSARVRHVRCLTTSVPPEAGRSKRRSGPDGPGPGRDLTRCGARPRCWRERRDPAGVASVRANACRVSRSVHAAPDTDAPRRTGSAQSGAANRLPRLTVLARERAPAQLLGDRLDLPRRHSERITNK